MKISVSNDIVRTVHAIRANRDCGLREAMDIAKSGVSLPMSTTLYLDLLSAGAIVTLEPGEEVLAHRLVNIVHESIAQINLWSTRAAKAEELLTHPSDEHGVVTP